MSCAVSEVLAYRCEGCGRTFPARSAAERCAAQGEPTFIPVGSCVEDGPVGGSALLARLVVVTDLGARNGHVYLPSAYTFRDGATPEATRHLSDSTQIGGPAVGDLAGRTIAVDTASPRYRRAWDHYAALGIPLSLIVDGRPVPAPTPAGREP